MNAFLQAIVWIAELPGQRVTIRAKSSGDAMAKLKTMCGDKAVISAWNDDDASRPRG